MISKLLKTLDTAFRPEEASTDHDEHHLQLAAAVLMVEVMRADHQLAPEEEERVISLLRRRFHLDEDETQALIQLAHAQADRAVSLHGFARTLTDGLEMDERAHIVELLWDLAFADSTIDRYEEHLIRQIAEWLYIPHSAFIRAKHRAKATYDG